MAEPRGARRKRVGWLACRRQEIGRHPVLDLHNCSRRRVVYFWGRYRWHSIEVDDLGQLGSSNCE
jgi:hypothetical protein